MSYLNVARPNQIQEYYSISTVGPELSNIVQSSQPIIGNPAGLAYLGAATVTRAGRNTRSEIR